VVRPAGRLSGLSGLYAVAVLDELDKRIIRLLQRNARVPNTEIGRALDVTETTIRNRVSRLLDEGLIEIVAVVAPRATEATVSAFLQLTLSPAGVEDAAEQLKERAEVRYLSLMIGRCQIMAEAFFRDLTHLLEFQNDVIGALPGVLGVEVMLVGRVHKLSYEWEI
jgi:Lrp/AsnC family transcriptional regulator, regulator for asnA, asnC and gidA